MIISRPEEPYRVWSPSTVRGGHDPESGRGATRGVAGDVSVCVCIKMPFVRLYSKRLQQLQKILRPSIQNIVRICKQIITNTFCEASNRSVVVKFVNTSTKILVIVIPTNFFIRIDFISYILSYLYLKYRPILMTYSHSNQCNVP
jgi:hypothetical protein